MTRRYPLDDLATAMGGISAHQACARLGISGRTQKEYRTRGIPSLAADRLAIRAGYHPYEIWPDMADHILDDHQPPEPEPDLEKQAEGDLIANQVLTLLRHIDTLRRTPQATPAAAQRPLDVPGGPEPITLTIHPANGRTTITIDHTPEGHHLT